MVPVFRVYNLPFIRKSVLLYNILYRVVDSAVNVDLYFIKSNRYLGSVKRCICDVKPSLCTSVLTISKNFKTYSTWKVILDENVNQICHIDDFADNLLFQQNDYVSVEPAQEMERTDLIGASGETTVTPLPLQTTVTCVKEDIETGKRKSEDGGELEKSGREKKRRGGGGKKLRPGERYIPPPQKRNPGVSFNQEHFSETSYYFEGGLRKVYPYYFDFKTYCKGRWIGKSLLEIFSSEFRAESVEYYKAAAKEGRIKLNEIPVEDLSTTLRNNDHMRNTVHRHEPPVVGQPLKVIVDDGEVLVVDKPASMPVHPCGRFRHNTVIFILGKERGITELHTVHRLDRLTSGVLLFARTLEMSKKLDTLVRERKIEKEYVCRVEGEFPEGELVCEEPILVVSFKVGLCRVDPKGKECRTVFQRLSYNGTTSVVRCLPLTGRTHQIRVHLQFLGFPILHDPIYGSCAWGPHRAKGGLVGMSDDDLLKALMDEHRSKQSLYLLDLHDDGMGIVQETKRTASGINKQAAQSNATGCAFEPDKPGGLPQIEKSEVTQGSRVGMQDLNLCDRKVSEVVQKGSLALNSSGSCPTRNSVRGSGESNCFAPTPDTSTDICKQVPSGTRDSLCSECKLVRPDPTEKELIMYLHALRYKGPDFEYSSSQPDWAKEDWIED